MNYITMFLKNRQRKKLVKEIDDLKVQSANFLENSHSEKICADSILRYANLQQKQAEHGDAGSNIWLSCYLSEYLEKYQKFSESAAINYQHYQNLQNRINFLNQKISKLDT